MNTPQPPEGFEIITDPEFVITEGCKAYDLDIWVTCIVTVGKTLKKTKWAFVARPLPPNWLKLTENCLPEANKPFWGSFKDAKQPKLFQEGYNRPEDLIKLLWTHWLHCEAPYAIPPLPVEEKVDEFEKWFTGNQDCHGDLKNEYKKGFDAALKAAKEHPEILEAI